MIKVEIWASGGGTNADKIMQHFADHSYITIASLPSNRKQAGAFSVADKHSVPSVYFSKAAWTPTEVLRQLNERKIDYIVLAGFLKLVPPHVIAKYTGKIINIHPSLLPEYGGEGMYGEHVHNAVLANNESVTGITIHEVNEAYDKGKILAQYATRLTPGDDLSSVKNKIQSLEHSNFASTIEAWIASKTRVL